MSQTVTIIGAGPAGMTAALFAARAGAQVRLIDSNAMAGRKLLVTGSGRANLTNQQMDAKYYTCADPAWMASLLGQFGHSELIEFLNSIGVLTFATSDGWCYPISESAQTVADAFRNALDLSGVELVFDTTIKTIQKKPQGFNLVADAGKAFNCDHLIVAAGGKAYPTLGSRGELFQSLKILGHQVIPLSPALAPVACDMQPYKKLQGIRLDARVGLYDGKELIAESFGNLIFTQWGINGPAVMDLSHHISTRTKARFELRLNLLHTNEAAFRRLIENQRSTPTPLCILFGAILPPKVPPIILPMAGFTPDMLINKLSNLQIDKLINLLTALPFKVTGVRGFEYCQVSAGGVSISEVDPANMKSRIVPGLALAGETLDVVGPCGGYNLQFAFSSGAVAGTHICDHR